MIAMKPFLITGLLLTMICLLGFVNFTIQEEKEASDGKNTNGSGIVFFGTKDLDRIKQFYLNRIGCSLWLDQGSCNIFRYGNLLIGFCISSEADQQGIITFFFEKKAQVDKMYQEFEKTATEPPKENEKYKIYHFFAKDPDGRAVEFQCFLHPIDWDFSEQKD